MPSAAEVALEKTLRTLGDKHLVVVTGAGISLASGIATFRGDDKNAVWKNDVTTMGTVGFFYDNPVESWRWYNARFASLEGKAPNAAHFALAELERWHSARGGRFTLVTQNIDGLHDDAESKNVVNVHGSAKYVRCPKSGCKNGAPKGRVLRTSIDLDAFKNNPSEETLPKCSECGAFYRQHVLWFDEMYESHVDYGYAQVRAAARDMDAILFVGTSFSVGVTEMFVRSAEYLRIPSYSVDPSERSAPTSSICVVREKSEELLPRLVSNLTNKS